MNCSLLGGVSKCSAPSKSGVSAKRPTCTVNSARSPAWAGPGRPTAGQGQRAEAAATSPSSPPAPPRLIRGRGGGTARSGGVGVAPAPAS